MVLYAFYEYMGVKTVETRRLLVINPKAEEDVVHVLSSNFMKYES